MNPQEALVSPNVGNTLEPVEMDGKDNDEHVEGQDEMEEKECGDELLQPEARDVLRRRPACLPSAEERQRHEVTHLPFRDWCKVCVAGAANDWGHRRDRGLEELAVPEVHFDYCFPRDKVGGEYVVVLVGRDRETRMTFSHVVPVKGGEMEWISEQIARDLLKLGHHGDLILRSDQEPAIVDLLNRVAKLRGLARTHLEHSPVGDSQANGVAERAVHTIEKLLRVHKLALEDRLGEPVPVQHPLVEWLVEHAADVYNRAVVGTDGKTAVQRLKGKPCAGFMVPFGAAVMFRVCGKVEGGNLAERWHTGRWVGKRLGTEEHFIMQADGRVVRARAVREMEETLSLADFDVLVSTPHDPTGTIRAALKDKGRGPVAAEGQGEPDPLGERATPRVHITKDVVTEFGPTADCRKCMGGHGQRQVVPARASLRGVPKPDGDAHARS